MKRIEVFDEHSFKGICDLLGKKDPDLQLILKTHHYPPFWKRATTFETLIHIILEQQVSLASALAAINKLKEKIGVITPTALLALTNEELKGCYFSRQKIIYARDLALAISDNKLILPHLEKMDNEEVRKQLIQIKGIGNWTVDVYLMMVLQRCDIFPLGDIALLTSVKEVKNLPKQISKEDIALIAAGWKPYQTIASFILWHAYLRKRNR